MAESLIDRLYKNGIKNPDAQHSPDVLSCLANLSNDEVFTPPEIVNRMLDMLPQELFSDPNTKFLDPACKTGVFLREIAKRLLIGLEPIYPDLQERIDHIFHNQLYGIAITELTSLLSRRSLYCSQYPNGQYSVSKFNSSEGNIRFKKIQHTWGKKYTDASGKSSSYCVYCGASQSQYDREPDKESHAYEFIHISDPEVLFGMKFDVIISNPPYHLSDGGAIASAKPIYHLFIEQAKKLNPTYIDMITPSRWFTGGKGLDDFRNDMLNDEHVKEIHDFSSASECFPGVEIKGGVNYFLWDKNYNNTINGVSVYNHKGNDYYVTKRSLKYSNYDVFIRDGRAISILDKARKDYSIDSLSKHVSSRKPFGLPGEFYKSNDYHETKTGLKNPIVCYSKGMKRGYIEDQVITVNREYINRYKVFVPRANNIGTESPDDNMNSFVGRPGEVSTESYMTVCADLNLSEIECENLSVYLKTKFARFCHLWMKASQDATAKTYQFVPMQDFKEKWDDKKLYKKYDLTEEEINFIEETIAPMSERE